MYKKSNRKKGLWPVLIVCAILLLFAAGCSSDTKSTDFLSGPETNNSGFERTTEGQPSGEVLSGQLKVHFLDVGQADSILVQLPNNQNMLIDAGDNDDGDTIVDYLTGAGVEKIDYLVGTHPHADHIGGMDTVIKNFTIGRVYMPRVTTTTKTFEDVLAAIEYKGLNINTAKAGLKIIDDGNLQALILAPLGTEYEEMNNYSAVIKVTWGEVSFLFTGDAEEQSEREMLASGVSLQANVLKVGHHGSHSSTSAAFLQSVEPQYAVICVGAGNDYGHPHRETMARLQGVNVFRTDLDGTVVFVTDGREINVTTGKNKPGAPGQTGEPGAAAEPIKSGAVAPNNERVYVDDGGRGLIKGNINSKGEKIYHMPDSPYYDSVKPERWFKTEKEALAAGFRPVKG
ncbi:ComEC/Rec2 family competence protein [Desulfallas thermosapovorans]|uniref:Competence protein ComEC n=1 Tax=Desulfallas thermosapovorans DSM 6562 TaxID=1121431 RepID=A0A5S4ZYL7_9FIRM|nr:MBL fold metallo-hydrolase [Desulfallas thermosapovorans]TYO97241.1 competence protein ComEC [Desulfallas thermosapovorans DSM 6562]